MGSRFPLGSVGGKKLKEDTSIIYENEGALA